MRQISILAIALLIYAFGYGQDSVLLTMYYRPMLNYNQTISEKTTTTVTYTGSDSALKPIRDKGIKNPTIIDKSLDQKLVTRTGALNDKKIMPVELEVLNDLNQGDVVVLSEGTKMFGTVALDKMPVFDSVGEGFDEETSKAQLQIVQSLFSQIVFPHKKMGIGEEYKIETPLVMNIGGFNIEMTFTQTYKLINANPATANFDLGITCTIKMKKDTEPGVPITGGGSGTGTLIFDRKHGFPLKYALDYTMDFTATRKNVLVDIQKKMQTANTYTITASSGRL